MGSGVGISYGVPISVATRWFPDKKGLIVGIVLFGFGLSPLITAPIASYFVNNYGVMKAFLLLGIAYFIIIPLLSYPMRCPENAAYSTTLNNVSKNTLSTHGSAMVQTKSFKGLYLNFMFGTMIGLMLIGMTNTIGVEFMQLSSDQVVLLMPLFAIFNGIGRPALGWLTDKYSIRTAMLISYGLIILAALLMLTSDPGSLLIYSISFSIFWFNLGGWLAIAPTSTLTLYGPKYYTQNYGIVFTSYGIGAIIGVYASGVLVDTFKNYYSVFYLVISICIIGIIASQRLLPKKV
jgi:MFS family permease